METKFGKWIESRGFPVTVNAVVILALGYMALRDANALDWGLHRSLYGPVFLVAGVVVLLFFTLLRKYHRGFPGACRRVAAYLLCFLIYDVPALLVCDLASALLGLGRPVRAGLILACTCLAGALLLYGSLHARRLKTVDYTVPLKTKNGPSKIVLLSDLHVGLFVGSRYLDRVVRRVNGLDPDLVLIAGDLLDGYLPEEAQLQAAARALRRLRAPLGVYAVTGNHDPDISDKRFQNFLQAAGIHMLYNEPCPLDGLTLVGRAGIVDMPRRRAPLAPMLRGLPAQPVLVIDHDPQGIREAAACGADLVVCGHTHRGQFFPMTVFTRWANGRDYFYGAGVHGHTRSIISAGTGFFGLPVRIGTDSEVVVIHLDPPQKTSGCHS